MANDPRKNWREAERLLKRGDLKAAMNEIRKVSEGASDDLQTLNRLGDLLARQGRNAEAVDYYSRVASQFETTGFIPKAIAMYKKIVRLDPQNLESIVRLGRLYLNRKLIGEARNYLLHGANQYLQAGDRKRAREIYEILAEAQPDDVRHQVRLAEVRASEGDKGAAVTGLVHVGGLLIERGDAAEAERIYVRATEILPDDPRPKVGLSRCLTAMGRTDEADALLATTCAAGEGSPDLDGELALCHAQAGRTEQALQILDSDAGLEIALDVWVQIFRQNLAAGRADTLWPRFDPLFAKAPHERIQKLYSELSDLEPNQHVPALARLAELFLRDDQRGAAIPVLERLVAAYRARSENDAAARVEGRIASLRPAVAPAPAGPEPIIVGHAADATPVQIPGSSDALPIDVEAPAVPLNRVDKDFVAGGMTQSEVLEKYDLLPQALEQIEEITERFPGHVESQVRRVAMLRNVSDEARLCRALVDLAVAQRAAGDTQEAKSAAEDAAGRAALSTEARALLERLSLVGEAGATASNTADDGSADMQAAAIEQYRRAGVPVAPLAQEAAVPDPVPTKPAGVPVVAAPSAAKPGGDGRRTRPPGRDMLDEIREKVEAGQLDDARRRVGSLRALGYWSEELDALDGLARGEGDAPTAPASEHAPADVPVVTLEIDDDDEGAAMTAAEATPTKSSAQATASFDESDDLGAMVAALGDELLEADEETILPESLEEQSIDDILCAFKDRVHEEVGDDDHRTHYDLGIAYKEMGLTDEAVREFEVASETPAFHREACSMIAMCRWEQGELAQAADWYRKALDGGAGEADVLAGLRYDLGEVLLQSGDAAAALTEFRTVLQLEPDYREARGRVADLEGRLQSS